MEIEPFRIDDYDELISLWDRCGLPYDLERRDNRAALEKQLFDDHVFILVLKDENRLIGSIVGSHDGRKGWINRLAVDPDYRGHQLAALLIGHVERYMFEDGIRVFAALIEDENLPSMSAFSRAGYEAWQRIIYFSKRYPQDAKSL
jgi:ribosomal protein S18 acetylase RimI-like enzyme